MDGTWVGEWEDQITASSEGYLIHQRPRVAPYLSQTDKLDISPKRPRKYLCTMIRSAQTFAMGL